MSWRSLRRNSHMHRRHQQQSSYSTIQSAPFQFTLCGKGGVLGLIHVASLGSLFSKMLAPLSILQMEREGALPQRVPVPDSRAAQLVQSLLSLGLPLHIWGRLLPALQRPRPAPPTLTSFSRGHGLFHQQPNLRMTQAFDGAGKRVNRRSAHTHCSSSRWVPSARAEHPSTLGSP